VLLALDLSSVATGFAFGDGSYTAPKVGVWRLPGAADDVFDRTLSVLGESILQLCRVIKATRVAIEAPIIAYGSQKNRSAHTAATMLLLTGVARGAAYTATKRNAALVASSTVRKHFVGHGFPDNPKKAVMDRCRLLGWQIDSHDAADAAALFAYDMAVHEPKWAPRSTPLFRGAA
jgi:hypothetical protein